MSQQTNASQEKAQIAWGEVRINATGLLEVF
jgi:hypothetical protein